MNNLKQLQQSLSVDVKLEQLIILTSSLLEELIDQQGGPCNSIFNSTSPPSITLPEFLHRLHKYTQFSSECLVIAIIYIDRYNLENSDFSLSRQNIHKILLSALLLAAKFQDDFYYDNKAFQFAGGVNVLHLHQLEMEIFQQLDFDLYVSQQQYYELQAKLYEVYSQEEES